MYKLEDNDFKKIDSNENKCGIYCILNKFNNKVYVGSSINIYNRVYNQHLNYLKNNTHNNKHLQRAYNKDKKHFVFLVLENVKDKKELINREQHWIDKLESYDRKNGYNFLKNAGSVLGLKHSQETKDIIAFHKRGSIVKDEVRKRISESHKKEIVQLDFNGDLINIWTSAIDAGRTLNINSGNISGCCTGNKRNAGGFLWMHKDKYFNKEITKVN